MVDQPASSELEVNAVSACQAAGHESRAESQSGAPVQDSHANKVPCTRRAREASSDFEPLAPKDEQSPKAVPQYKRSRELPPPFIPFVRRQSPPQEKNTSPPLDSANIVPKDASRTPSRDIASDPCKGLRRHVWYGWSDRARRKSNECVLLWEGGPEEYRAEMIW